MNRILSYIAFFAAATVSVAGINDAGSDLIEFTNGDKLYGRLTALNQQTKDPELRSAPTNSPISRSAKSRSRNGTALFGKQLTQPKESQTIRFT